MRYMCLLAVLLVACGSSGPARNGGGSSSGGNEGPNRPSDDRSRCETDGSDLEVSEYDTSGDDHPDVRKVYRRLGEGGEANLILICREVDLNHDGIKDVYRYYNDEGRPLREEGDRNFDGQLDERLFFESGVVVRVERDSDYDGRFDTHIFYEEGRPVRGERDVSGRSTASNWRPDRWEYYERGQLVRIGSDLDGDGQVDRWDRDVEYTRRLEQERAEREAAEAREDTGSDDDEGDEEDEDDAAAIGELTP